jgi:glycosyltransferase involved in cell wall biosynthesis
VPELTDGHAPFFTIIVSTFGRGRHILPTIDAALAQTFRDFEIIVVADGDGDGTLRHVPRDDPRVNVIALPRNSGSQAVPNNVGIAVARGHFIAYLGHDDIWMPDHLEALLRVIEWSRCDVAVSGCVYHGPPTTDLWQVTGIGDELDARHHFFPPTSFAHRTALAAEIGGWRDPLATSAPVDADLLLRLVEAGAEFVSTGEVTAHKFAAGHRYLSYLDHSSAEQSEMLAAIRSGVVDRRVCQGYIDRAKADGTFMILGNDHQAGLKPGEIYRQNRSNKGIDRAKLVSLTGEVFVPMTPEPRALDWYPAESADGGGLFRWSGPSLRPKILIPFAGDIGARITLHLTSFDPANAIDGIQLRLNDAAVEHATRRDHPARVDLEAVGLLRAAAPSVLTLIIPRYFCPAESTESADKRRLGIVMTGFTIAPL